MTEIILTTATFIIATYVLWILYLAVMNLKRVKDNGQLHPFAYYLGLPVFIFGYILDVVLNIILMTIILLELPRELTITSRLQRHNKSTSGWRKKIVTLIEPILDPFDPSGNHI